MTMMNKLTSQTVWNAAASQVAEAGLRCCEQLLFYCEHWTAETVVLPKHQHGTHNLPPVGD